VTVLRLTADSDGKNRHARRSLLTVPQDTDPLADSVPPRHAIESDEEEDEYNPLRPQPNLPLAIDVQVVGTVTPVPVSGLVVATGSMGKYWARGAELGEQVAAVMVNKIQVNATRVH
jgi:hypothetical protein